MILYKVYVVIKKTKVCLNGWNTEACEEEAVKLEKQIFHANVFVDNALVYEI